MRSPITMGVVTVVVVALLSAAAPGAVLTLSDLSSDETDPELLDATFIFDVVGSSLLFTASNDTPPVGGYDLTAIYFNARSNVTELILDPAVPGWTFHTGESADGFGVFDFALISDSSNDEAQIQPGESLAFTFDIVGTTPFVNDDFTTEFSVIPPGEHPALAAAKFQSGPGDDSAFGAVVVPEPATLLLGLIGAGMICHMGRGRRQAHVR